MYIIWPFLVKWAYAYTDGSDDIFCSNDNNAVGMFLLFREVTMVKSISDIKDLERFLTREQKKIAVVSSAKAMQRARVSMIKQANIELRKYYNIKAAIAKQAFDSKVFTKSNNISDHRAEVWASKRGIPLIEFLTPSAKAKLSKSTKGIPIRKRPKARITIRRGNSIPFTPRFLYKKNGTYKVGLRSKDPNAKPRPQVAPSASAFAQRSANHKSVRDAGLDQYLKQFASFYKNSALWYGRRKNKR